MTEHSKPGQSQLSMMLISIRSAFEKWMNTINKLDDGTGETDPALYQKDAIVNQLDRDGWNS